MAYPQKLYNQVMMADDFTCVYCGKRTPEVHVDHFVPRSQGGPDVLSNLFACCQPCNNRKRDHCAHEVNMYPRFGRFKAYSKQRPYPKPKRKTPDQESIVLPDVDSHIEQARILATQLGKNGVYAYSANRIVLLVGGSRDIILNAVRSVRQES